MIVLDETNQIVNTDFVNQAYRFWTLSFDDFRDPDFFVRETGEIMVYNAAGITLEFRTTKTMYRIVVPLHWWILCAELDEIQTIPLYELSRNDYKAFGYNPLNSFRPESLSMRVSVDTPAIYPNANWSSPPVGEKDLILIPLSEAPDSKGIGPLCVIFSTNKFEVSRSAADIWS